MSTHDVAQVMVNILMVLPSEEHPPHLLSEACVQNGLQVLESKVLPVVCTKGTSMFAWVISNTPRDTRSFSGGCLHFREYCY